MVLHFLQELPRELKSGLVAEHAIDAAFRTEGGLPEPGSVVVDPVKNVRRRIDRKTVEAPAEVAGKDFGAMKNRVVVRSTKRLGNV